MSKTEDRSRAPALALKLKDEGNKLYKNGNYVEASSKYEEAITADPSIPALHSNLCLCHNKLCQYEQMEVSARKCIELDGNFIKGHYWLAVSLEGRSMYRDAIKVCDNASEIDPHNRDIMHLKDHVSAILGDDLAELMEKCDLVRSKDPMGNSLLVSKELQKCTTGDGTFNFGKLNGPRRGICAYPGCEKEENDGKPKLMRCSLCFQVDYCSKKHQKLDWKRHKLSECEDSRGDNDAKDSSMVGWQAIVYEGMGAKKRGKYTKAIDLFNQAMKKEPSLTHSLVTMLSACYLQRGDAAQALRYAYQACQCNHGDPMSLLIKAKCHMQLGDVESAFLSCYSAMNAHVNTYWRKEYGDDRIEKEHIIPLYKKLMQPLVEHFLKGREGMLQSSFTMGVTISSVPFSMDYAQQGKMSIIQEPLGEGLHICHPQNVCPRFPIVVEHTAIAYKSRIVIFGGREEGHKTTNATRVFAMDNKHCYSHHVQYCTGEMPPPSQGHSACLLGQQMYIFGGDAQLNDMYRLDLESWKWTKLKSISQTPNRDRPETDVLFSALVQFGDDSIVLIGGRLAEASRSALSTRNGLYESDHHTEPISNNLHIYSVKTGQWRKIPDSSQAPRGWQIHAHNVGEKRVLVLSGHTGCPAPNKNINSLHLLSADAGGNLVWEHIEENLNGIPPSLSYFRASTWDFSARCLLLYGGRFLNTTLEDSVLKAKNNEEDLTPIIIYDTEIYCFRLDLKQWIRLRVAGETVARHSHSMTVVDGKLISLGGCVLAQFDEREYVTKVTCYDLDFTKVEKVETMNAKPGKKKGKRKGKKKR
mmetsp:Transcript_20588/g.44716  ORF Transcript_20588/g.44716 Transcript_20588/m.44716 type:complete len:811 (+) Transcript_20588:402-2834(+)|eukprot:CAMPEP_0172305070 /NCGR_PEP_ID=MMETSP1058-20130122/6403_1 /TAXON_ID=83371 /ORGANISM="Detonula confervacea, Strain CCMP 353" /LENGTH=810 /DNA_ID=CAMNT_0013016533 /DNA_START=322 /DNA_END=2754 /DNA_ORIENTATION=+